MNEFCVSRLMAHLCPDAKRTYLRRKYTSTKKVHFTEGWVEFKDKKIARSVAEMLNAQPIGGKKGSRWRDDVWTMKYLPKFKWNMLTEQIGWCLSGHAINPSHHFGPQLMKLPSMPHNFVSNYRNQGVSSRSTSRMWNLHACWTNVHSGKHRRLVKARLRGVCT